MQGHGFVPWLKLRSQMLLSVTKINKYRNNKKWHLFHLPLYLCININPVLYTRAFIENQTKIKQGRVNVIKN